MSFRKWLNIFTFVIILVTLFALRDELMKAYELLQRVNLWILLWIIPLQLLSYLASGETLFSYLKQRGTLKDAHPWETTRMALELNFVNHILPSGGVSGASYMTWRLSKLGVGSGRATLAQAVRLAAQFLSYAALLLIAVVLITIDSGVNRYVILVSSGLASTIVFGTLILIYAINSRSRLESFSRGIAGAVNYVSRKLTRKKKKLLSSAVIERFLSELHDDYVALKGDPRVLIKPFLWGVLFNICEVALFFVTFWALGSFVNPALILIAVGVASVGAFFLVTPGGAGGYEALMVLFLTSAGVNAGAVLAGVLLARTILILMTIGTGYIFYHQALKKYGKAPDISI